MAKVHIFYFSGTGNTWWVAEKLACGFCERGWHGEAISIEAISCDCANALINETDIVGFGYPIYGSDLPQIMKDFICQLEPVQEKKAFAFCTQWLWSGDGARVGESFLTPKGFEVDWGEHFLMPNNVCIPITSFLFLPYTNDKNKIEPKLKAVERRINQFVERILEGQKTRRGFNFIAQLLGALQRVPFRKGFQRMRNSIGINHDRCSRCGMCADNCPSGNIAFNENQFIPRGVCILCLRCYNYCPHSAITYGGKSHNLNRSKPYKGPVQGFSPKILRENNDVY